jgi:hypothetical protein
VQCFSKVSASRRGLNSHNAAQPRSTAQRRKPQVFGGLRAVHTRASPLPRRSCDNPAKGIEYQRHGAALRHRASALRRKHVRSLVSSSGRCHHLRVCVRSSAAA